MENSIRVAVGQLRELTDHDLQFAAQLGVKGVQLNGPNVPGEKRWEYMDLLQLRMRAEDAGLKLEALENTPLSFYDHAMLGLPGPRRANRKLPGDDSQRRPRRNPHSRLPLDAESGLENVADHARPGADRK